MVILDQNKPINLANFDNQKNQKSKNPKFVN